jgi:hypothetical protein
VLRRITTSGLVLALLFAAAGACLACSNLLAKTSAHDCCDKAKSKCPRPQEKAPIHEHCAAPAANTATILTSGNDALVAAPVLPLAAVATITTSAPAPETASPPPFASDRCLLNSVLRV